MKINRHYFYQSFPVILILIFSTFVFGIEKTEVNISDRSVSIDKAENKLALNLEKIQQLRLLKQQQPQLTAETRESTTKVQPVFSKQERGGWLPGKTPSFLKKRPYSIIPVFNRNSMANIQILFNGSADTTHTIGDTLTITVYFLTDTGQDSAMIGGWLDNGDGVFNDTTDIWIFDEGDDDMWIFDNDDEDENLDLGIFEISFVVDPADMGDDDDMIFFLLEGALLFFTATESSGATAMAHLDIEGMDTDISISGLVVPATTNFIVIAIPSWEMEMEEDKEPSEIWAAVTDTNGAYSIHVQDQGQYFILAFDMFGVTAPQLFSEDFLYEVVVFDSITDLDINLVEANAWIAGTVVDQDGAPVSDMIVWANNGPFEVEATTDANGDYTLGVMALNDPFGDDYWETRWNLNVDEDELWPDYMIPREREVFIKTGDYIDDPELTHFTLYANDASISGSIYFPAGLDINCFGIYIDHYEMQVSNWVDFCDDGNTSPVSYSIRVSSHLDPDEFEIGMWIDGDEENFIRIPEGHQASSGATGIDFELVMANARLEGKVFSAVDDFPIEHAWISIHNDSVSISRGTDHDGYFSLPALGDLWYNLEVYAEGFEPFHKDSIFISTNDTLWLDIPMQYEGGDFEGPHLYVVEDVPDDQGYRVRIQWNAGNPGWWGYYTGYSIWRHVPGRDQHIWDFVRMVPWHGYGDYSTIVPTLGNATPFDTTWSEFIVTAHTEDPNFFMDSNPMIGFSVDNLHPSPPLGLLAAAGDGNVQVELSWRPVHVPDFDYFTVYRGTAPGFEPDEPYDFTIDTAFVDAGVTAGESYYYVVTAMDFNGNESDFSNEASASLLGTGNETFIPDKYALAQNYPNPFNPVTTITYDLPQDAKVTLIVYDILGNEIRTLVNDNLPAGRYRHKLNASNLTSGIYFYRIDAGDFKQTKKMMILK
ncbi:MAG: T9SS type A sorting domain-containing protein [Candidatus Marinimicrobia bacterium]|nr:T9SS type A sorting domain-containing protein [Candidatus Neomarinimicrobiota bacterium]